jgi:hypothetical protein
MIASVLITSHVDWTNSSQAAIVLRKTPRKELKTMRKRLYFVERFIQWQ